ncbi:CoA pyrophosphatase [Myroides odoratimimus]|uniref:NUDIX hydrolase n=1 Tax=Myroides odoratimimus TaxID=76832 RepID=UPI00257695AE|nr:CoA pyrophosphatase [Myroides odoratimimus]MDM1396520.1 CoA pyrophosphatase [Myroides odoratimimus]
MTFDSLLHRIPEIKSVNLLGVEAQQLMVPEERRPYLAVDDFIKKDPRYSAVMMLLYPKGEDTSILLIERASCGGVHSGQIGFPGGKYEEEDLSLEMTALRETDEEIGVSPSKIQVLKAFTRVYIPPSNFIVQPYLGVIDHTPKMTLSVDEVASVIEMPLKTLLDDSIVREVGLQTSYAKFIDVPAYVYNDFTIWGATAMMLSELKETIKQIYK